MPLPSPLRLIRSFRFRLSLDSHERAVRCVLSDPFDVGVLWIGGAMHEDKPTLHEVLQAAAGSGQRIEAGVELLDRDNRVLKRFSFSAAGFEAMIPELVGDHDEYAQDWIRLTGVKVHRSESFTP